MDLGTSLQENYSLLLRLRFNNYEKKRRLLVTLQGHRGKYFETTLSKTERTIFMQEKIETTCLEKEALYTRIYSFLLLTVSHCHTNSCVINLCLYLQLSTGFVQRMFSLSSHA